MATIQDIARISGYSIGTVSRVINNRADVSAEARRKIEEVIREQNYQPNSSARMLRQSISSEISIEELEQMLSRELPRIGDKIPAIVSGPTYKGVTQLGKGTMTISILTECKEADYHKVQRSVNRELQSLFKSNGISI